MINYRIKTTEANLLDFSTPEKQDYTTGDVIIILQKWESQPTNKFFEEAEATIQLSGLPQPLQKLYFQFEKELMEYILTLT